MCYVPMGYSKSHNGGGPDILVSVATEFPPSNNSKTSKLRYSILYLPNFIYAINITDTEQAARELAIFCKI